jgi:5-methylthioadenosine/S-adenosylhomocysteine deaminase
MHELAIKNGLCYLQGEFIRANIGIDANKITYVGKEEIEGEVKIDASKSLVLPGFFNAHTHLAMSLLRGYAEDMPLMEWLKKKIWRAERKLKARDVYWGSMLGILEMLKTGTTCFSDLYIHMDQVAKACLESGIRAVLSYGMADREDPERGREEIKIGEEFIKKWGGGRIKAIFGPHAPYTCSLEFLKEVRAKADELGVEIHIHVSETKEEVEEFREKYASKPIVKLEEIGFLSPKTIIAHGVWLDKEEMEILARRLVSVVHCPVSNLKLASGIAKIVDMHRLGINLCLGTDGAASNNTYNLFEEIKLASLLQKVQMARADALHARDVIEMATANGYKAYGINAGKIERGMLADLILLEKSFNYTPLYNPLYSIVYSSFGCEVTHTIVDGKLLVEERQPLTLDGEKILSKVEKIKEKFLN